MTVTEDTYTAGTGPDDFLAADEPPEPEPEGELPEAPYGWTRDRKTGELRPKLRPGRPHTPPGADELRATGPLPPQAPDQAPGTTRRPKATTPGTMPAGGVIATGVNRLYRRAGRIVRAMDHDIGAAIIECTRPDPDDPDFVTVGQAWENLAKTSPGVRRVLLGLIRGGTWQDLILAHAPIGMALVMKPAIQRLIVKLSRVLPLGKLVAAYNERDEDEGGEPRGEKGDKMAGLSEEDVRKMADQMGFDMDKMAERAAAHLAGQDVPAGFRRQQPRNRSRAARRK